MMMNLMMLIMLVLLLLTVVQLMLSMDMMMTDMNTTSVESGFEKLWQTMFASSPFFFLGILFVLFDMELVLLLPVITEFKFIQSTIIILSLLMMMVSITLALEWMWSGLKWQM